MLYVVTCHGVVSTLFSKYNTWEPWENLTGAEELLNDFKRNSGAITTKSKKRKNTD